MIRELHEVELFDVSVVAFPAYTQTSVAVRSLWPEGMPEEIEKAKQKAARPARASAQRKRVEEEKSSSKSTACKRNHRKIKSM